jgi:hypothetical protein
MFFSGNNIFNQSDDGDKQMYLSLPQKLSPSGNVVKAVFSWSNLGIIEKSGKQCLWSAKTTKICVLHSVSQK